MTRVLVQLRESLVRRIADAVPGAVVTAIPWEGDIPADAHGDVLVTLPWASPNLPQALDRGVRWVHALGTGVDRFPTALLGDRVLTCSRGGSAIPIAEWVLAVMLAFEKRLPDAWIHDVPADGWSRTHLGGLHGRMLALVGVGGIGTAVVERVRPFGMRIRAVRRTPGAPGPDGVEMVSSLHDLVRDADHVVLAAPATAETRHLVDDALIAAMKPGVHLVNVARGALVDDAALRRALDDGRIACASLDAVEPEPLPRGHWMYEHPRVRVSPHVSWSMPGAAELLVDCVIENLHRWQAGAPLVGVVDRTSGY